MARELAPVHDRWRFDSRREDERIDCGLPKIGSGERDVRVEIEVELRFRFAELVKIRIGGSGGCLRWAQRWQDRLEAEPMPMPMPTWRCPAPPNPLWRWAVW